MKFIFSMLLLLAINLIQKSNAQTLKYQTDQHVINQQERMVFKQWDSEKFTPTKGFLGLNPNYWLTWGLHPNYPKTDIRPLRASGPQTQRLLLVAAMKNTEEAYKKHTDTLKNITLSEIVSFTGAISSSDPLWQRYYQNEFQYLVERPNPLEGSTIDVQQYMIQTGMLEWYSEELTALAQRLHLARTTNIERGARILSYHHLLQEYRQLLTNWESKKNRAQQYLNISKANAEIKDLSWSTVTPVGRSDRQIADDILSKSKL